jgi:hypothetical protein
MFFIFALHAADCAVAVHVAAISAVQAVDLVDFATAAEVFLSLSQASTCIAEVLATATKSAAITSRACFMTTSRSVPGPGAGTATKRRSAEVGKSLSPGHLGGVSNVQKAVNGDSPFGPIERVVVGAVGPTATDDGASQVGARRRAIFPCVADRQETAIR